MDRDEERPLMPLPPMAAIRCFEAAARCLNFTRAGEELGMTQAAVSYQIKILEDRLGPLFIRQARTLKLTPLGQTLAPAVTHAFATLHAAFADAQHLGQNRLVVSTAHMFASNWLVPRLSRFQKAHPHIDVRVDVNQRLVDFATEAVDVAIRTGEQPHWPGLEAHRLGPVNYTPMLSPHLLAKAGALTSPADLLRLPIIDPKDAWWGAWFSAAGLPGITFANRPDINLSSQQLVATLALAGQGVAMLSPSFYPDEIASGRLIQPFPLVHSSGAHYWLVYAHTQRKHPKISAFRAWLLAALAVEPIQ